MSYSKSKVSVNKHNNCTCKAYHPIFLSFLDLLVERFQPPACPTFSCADVSFARGFREVFQVGDDQTYHRLMKFTLYLPIILNTRCGDLKRSRSDPMDKLLSRPTAFRFSKQEVLQALSQKRLFQIWFYASDLMQYFTSGATNPNVKFYKQTRRG